MVQALLGTWHWMLTFLFLMNVSLLNTYVATFICVGSSKRLHYGKIFLPFLWGGRAGLWETKRNLVALTAFSRWVGHSLP